MSYEKKIFVFAGETELDITADATSEGIEMPENYLWSVSPNIVAAITGAPTYTIEVSSDGHTWFEYTSDLTDMAITTSTGVEGFEYILMRIVVSANSASAGDVEFLLVRREI